MGLDDDKQPMEILDEIVEDKELRNQFLKYDQIAAQASNEIKISALETQISALGDRVQTMTKKSEEGSTLKEFVKSFFTNLSGVETRIKEDTRGKIETSKTDLGKSLKEEMDKQKKKWEADMADSTKDDVKFWRLKYYKEEMEKIKIEGIKLRKDAERASKNIPSKTSFFSVLLGSFINLQTIKQNSEYYWLLIVLTITMLIGTLFIIVMSSMKLRKTEKELSKLQTSQEPLYVQGDQLREEIRLMNPEESTLLYWKFQEFSTVAAKRETYGERSWSHWFYLSIFSLFSFIIPILLLIDTVINAKSPATNGGSCCPCTQRNILDI